MSADSADAVVTDDGNGIASMGDDSPAADGMAAFAIQADHALKNDLDGISLDVTDAPASPVVPPLVPLTSYDMRSLRRAPHRRRPRPRHHPG